MPVTAAWICCMYRALSSSTADRIPAARLTELRQIVCCFYGVEQLDSVLIQQAASIDTRYLVICTVDSCPSTQVWLLRPMWVIDGAKRGIGQNAPTLQRKKSHQAAFNLSKKAVWIVSIQRPTGPRVEVGFFGRVQRAPFSPAMGLELL